MLGQVTPPQFYNPTGTYVQPGAQYSVPGYAPGYAPGYGYTTQGSFVATVDPVLILGLGAVVAFLLLKKK